MTFLIALQEELEWLLNFNWILQFHAPVTCKKVGRRRNNDLGKPMLSEWNHQWPNISEYSNIMSCLSDPRYLCILITAKSHKKTEPPPSRLTHVCLDTIDTLTYDNFFFSSLSTKINIWLKIAIVRNNLTSLWGLYGSDVPSFQKKTLFFILETILRLKSILRNNIHHLT